MGAAKSSGKAAKKTGLRRGEREATVKKLGKATPNGMAKFMAGVHVARGEFEAVKVRKKK